MDGYVLAATVNLRAGPGTGYDVLGEYERYDTLLVTGTCEEWYRVKLDGLRGYMLKEFVAMGDVPEPTPAYAVEELDEGICRRLCERQDHQSAGRPWDWILTMC